MKSCDEPVRGVSLETMTQFTVKLDRETDGRWIAEIPALPGAMCYGLSKEEASRKVEALALRILADRIENGDEAPEQLRRVRRLALPGAPPSQMATVRGPRIVCVEQTL